MRLRVLALGAALLCASGAAGLADSDDAPPADAPAPHVAVVRGATTITLDARARRNAGIVTAPVAAATRLGGEAAYGTIVSAAALAPVAARLAGDAARRDSTAAAAEAARQDLRRARALYADAHNASAATVQAAMSTAAAADAARVAANADLAADMTAARQRWGGALLALMQGHGDAWRGLMAGKLLLARLDLAADAPVAAAPAMLTARLADGAALRLRLVGQAGAADATLLGAGFYYLTAARPDTLPGMRLLARWPGGGAGTAVRLPQAALVWLHGDAFVYVRTGPGTFVRTRVTPEQSDAADDYVARGVKPGASLVVIGAQLLLSEEFRAVATAGGDQD